jgi:hypothetical protein
MSNGTWKCNACDPSCKLDSDDTEPSACPYRYDDYDWQKSAAPKKKSAKKPTRRSAPKSGNHATVAGLQLF